MHMYVQTSLLYTVLLLHMYADSMVAEVLEAVHHLDATYAAFYTAMMSEAEMESNTYVCDLPFVHNIMYLAYKINMTLYKH